MRRVAACLLLLSAPAPTQAPPPPAADPAPAPIDESLRLRPADSRMTTEVRIDGQGPFRFIVDTGANRTVIARGLAERLGLPSAGRGRMTSTGGTGAVDLVTIERLDLGTLRSGPIRAPVLEEENLGAAGILGIDVLGDKKVVMDLVADRMTVSPAGGSSTAGRDPEEIVVVARRRFGELVLVDADIDGQRIWVVLDTGASGSIGNSALRAKLARRRGTFAPRAITLLDVAGNQIPALFSQLPTIRIGGIRVQGAPAAFSDVETFRQFGLSDRPAMLLGMDLLRLFKRVSIDFGTRRVRFLLDRS